MLNDFDLFLFSQAYFYVDLCFYVCYEENILYPVALYAQMLWNWDEDLSQMMNDVALRSYVDFA